jgi:predicted acyl esterase
MKKVFLLLALAGFHCFAFSQTVADSLQYMKTSYMIPMRDGVQLNTIVLTPDNQNVSYPFLLERTPYGVDGILPEGDVEFTISDSFRFYNLASGGYIFVFQDIRGKHKSQGNIT